MTVERESAARRVYRHVKERILDGRFADATLLSEGAVAEELSVSRTPVREAFVQLETEGLLRLYPRRGALVVPITPRDVADLIDTRRLIEGHALTRTVGDAATLGAMAAEIDAQRAAFDDPARFAARDRDFHRHAVAATGNAVLLGLYDSLRERQQRMTRRSLSANPGTRAQTILDEHEAILEALRAGEVDRALVTLDQHLEVLRSA